MTADTTADVVLAHQALLHALPFVVPALLVVLAIAAVVVRDRRQAAREDEQA